MRSVLLVGCAALMCCAAPEDGARPAAPRMPAAPAAPRADGAPRARRAASVEDLPGLDLLTTAIAQAGEPELWSDAGESARQARTLMAAARGIAPSPALDAALATADALLAWHAEVEYGARAGDVVPETAELWGRARGPLQQGVITLLTLHQGLLPQTDELLVGVLFQAGRAQRAATELADALRRWPAHAPLHAIARRRREALPEPGVLVSQLQQQLAGEDAALPGFEAQAHATIGYLSLSWGLAAQDAGDRSKAARLFEEGAAALALADAPGQTVDRWELDNRRADCLVNAGWLRHAEASDAIAKEGLDAARPALELAEQDFVGALLAVPEDPDATKGVAFTGDLYYQAGSQEGIREYFGRVAPQFDNPEWWNNYAFFCRETGEYERSYEAYRKCIAIAPDNARWVNDTGLILLYHLNRDLDEAERLFRRAWKLGRDVCDNPFVSKDVADEAFLAYTDAMHNLSLLLARRGDLPQAIEVNSELLRVAPGRPDATQLKAQLEQAQAEAEADTPAEPGP